MGRDFVYFVTYENGPIKIGKAKNISNRMKTLQTSVPHKLKLLGVMGGCDGLEKSLHRKFSSLRLEGEWFENKDPLISFIDKHSCDPEALFHKKDVQSLRAEVISLREKLANKSSQIEISLKEKVIEDLQSSFSARIAYILEDIFECQKDLYYVLNGIKKESGYILADKYEHKIRRVVDHLLDCRWQDSNMMLRENNFDRDVAQKRANTIIRKVFDLTMKQFEKKENELVYYKKIARDWYYQVGKAKVDGGEND